MRVGLGWRAKIARRASARLPGHSMSSATRSAVASIDAGRNGMSDGSASAPAARAARRA